MTNIIKSVNRECKKIITRDIDCIVLCVNKKIVLLHLLEAVDYIISGSSIRLYGAYSILIFLYSCYIAIKYTLINANLVLVQLFVCNI